MSPQDADPPELVEHVTEDLVEEDHEVTTAVAAREARHEREAVAEAASRAELAKLEAEAQEIAAARQTIDLREQLEEKRRERASTREHLEFEALRMKAERERMEQLEGKKAAVEAERERLARERDALVTRQRLELERIDRRLEELARAALLREGRPPILVTEGTKRKARLQLSASVLIDHDGHAEVLSLLNVSLTGGLISTAGTQLGKLRVGSLLFVTLIATDDLERQVDVNARVVRHDGDATAIDWSADEAAAHGVAQLLDALAVDA